ncbi:unnamed protein product [Coregonus sp. 'balchen']|nr:unnamed protein product [Coregonus sp. 'balchen']
MSFRSKVLLVSVIPVTETGIKTPKKTPTKKSPQKKAVVLSVNGEQEPAKKTAAKKTQQETPQVSSTSAPAVPNLRETPEEPETWRQTQAEGSKSYLHTLTKEVYNQPDNATKNDWESSSGPCSSSTQPQKKTRGKGKKRKAPEFDSDNTAKDKDFVSENKDYEEEESEDEDTQEDLDLELRHTPPKDLRSISRGHVKPDTMSTPRLAYGIAQDKGSVWNVKWCPGGAWELPTTNKGRNRSTQRRRDMLSTSLIPAPHMPRLCLLDASTSDSHIIYSMPQPNTLQARRKHTTKG